MLLRELHLSPAEAMLESAMFMQLSSIKLMDEDRTCSDRAVGF